MRCWIGIDKWIEAIFIKGASNEIKAYYKDELNPILEQYKKEKIETREEKVITKLWEDRERLLKLLEKDELRKNTLENLFLNFSYYLDKKPKEPKTFLKNTVAISKLGTTITLENDVSIYYDLPFTNDVEKYIRSVIRILIAKLESGNEAKLTFISDKNFKFTRFYEILKLFGNLDLLEPGEINEKVINDTKYFEFSIKLKQQENIRALKRILNYSENLTNLIKNNLLLLPISIFKEDEEISEEPVPTKIIITPTTNTHYIDLLYRTTKDEDLKELKENPDENQIIMVYYDEDDEAFYFIIEDKKYFQKYIPETLLQGNFKITLKRIDETDGFLPDVKPFSINVESFYHYTKIDKAKSEELLSVKFGSEDGRNIFFEDFTSLSYVLLLKNIINRYLQSYAKTLETTFLFFNDYSYNEIMAFLNTSFFKEVYYNKEKGGIFDELYVLYDEALKNPTQEIKEKLVKTFNENEVNIVLLYLNFILTSHFEIINSIKEEKTFSSKELKLKLKKENEIKRALLEMFTLIRSNINDLISVYYGDTDDMFNMLIAEYVNYYSNLEVDHNSLAEFIVKNKDKIQHLNDNLIGSYIYDRLKGEAKITFEDIKEEGTEDSDLSDDENMAQDEMDETDNLDTDKLLMSDMPLNYSLLSKGITYGDSTHSYHTFASVIKMLLRERKESLHSIYNYIMDLDKRLEKIENNFAYNEIDIFLKFFVSTSTFLYMSQNQYSKIIMKKILRKLNNFFVVNSISVKNNNVFFNYGSTDHYTAYSAANKHFKNWALAKYLDNLLHKMNPDIRDLNRIILFFLNHFSHSFSLISELDKQNKEESYILNGYENFNKLLKSFMEIYEKNIKNKILNKQFLAPEDKVILLLIFSYIMLSKLNKNYKEGLEIFKKNQTMLIKAFTDILNILYAGENEDEYVNYDLINKSYFGLNSNNYDHVHVFLTHCLALSSTIILRYFEIDKVEPTKKKGSSENQWSNNILNYILGEIVNIIESKENKIQITPAVAYCTLVNRNSILEKIDDYLLGKLKSDGTLLFNSIHFISNVLGLSINYNRLFGISDHGDTKVPKEFTSDSIRRALLYIFSITGNVFMPIQGERSNMDFLTFGANIVPLNIAPNTKILSLKSIKSLNQLKEYNMPYSFIELWLMYNFFVKKFNLTKESKIKFFNKEIGVDDFFDMSIFYSPLLSIKKYFENKIDKKQILTSLKNFAAEIEEKRKIYAIFILLRKMMLRVIYEKALLEYLTENKVKYTTDKKLIPKIENKYNELKENFGEEIERIKNEIKQRIVSEGKIDDKIVSEFIEKIIELLLNFSNNQDSKGYKYITAFTDELKTHNLNTFLEVFLKGIDKEKTKEIINVLYTLPKKENLNEYYNNIFKNIEKIVGIEKSVELKDIINTFNRILVKHIPSSYKFNVLNTNTDEEETKVYPFIISTVLSILVSNYNLIHFSLNEDLQEILGNFDLYKENIFTKRIHALSSTGINTSNTGYVIEFNNNEEPEEYREYVASLLFNDEMNFHVNDDFKLKISSSPGRRLIEKILQLNNPDFKLEDFDNVCSDGWGLTTLPVYRILMQRYNLWTPLHERVYTLILKIKKTKDPVLKRKYYDEIIKIITLSGKNLFPVLKLQYAGNVKNSYFFEPYNHKFSVMPVIPELLDISGEVTFYHEIEKTMIDNNIHYIVFDSANKIANISKVDEEHLLSDQSLIEITEEGNEIVFKVNNVGKEKSYRRSGTAYLKYFKLNATFAEEEKHLMKLNQKYKLISAITPSLSDATIKKIIQNIKELRDIIKEDKLEMIWENDVSNIFSVFQDLSDERIARFMNKLRRISELMMGKFTGIEIAKGERLTPLKMSMIKAIIELSNEGIYADDEIMADVVSSILREYHDEVARPLLPGTYNVDVPQIFFIPLMLRKTRISKETYENLFTYDIEREIQNESAIKFKGKKEDKYEIYEIEMDEFFKLFPILLRDAETVKNVDLLFTLNNKKYILRDFTYDTSDKEKTTVTIVVESYKEKDVNTEIKIPYDIYERMQKKLSEELPELADQLKNPLYFYQNIYTVLKTLLRNGFVTQARFLLDEIIGNILKSEVVANDTVSKEALEDLRNKISTLSEENLDNMFKVLVEHSKFEAWFRLKDKKSILQRIALLIISIIDYLVHKVGVSLKNVPIVKKLLKGIHDNKIQRIILKGDDIIIIYKDKDGKEKKDTIGLENIKQLLFNEDILFKITLDTELNIQGDEMRKRQYTSINLKPVPVAISFKEEFLPMIIDIVKKFSTAEELKKIKNIYDLIKMFNYYTSNLYDDPDVANELKKYFILKNRIPLQNIGYININVPFTFVLLTDVVTVSAEEQFISGSDFDYDKRVIFYKTYSIKLNNKKINPKKILRSHKLLQKVLNSKIDIVEDDTSENHVLDRLRNVFNITHLPVYTTAYDTSRFKKQFTEIKDKIDEKKNTYLEKFKYNRKITLLNNLMYTVEHFDNLTFGTKARGYAVYLNYLQPLLQGGTVVLEGKLKEFIDNFIISFYLKKKNKAITNLPSKIILKDNIVNYISDCWITGVIDYLKDDFFKPYFSLLRSPFTQTYFFITQYIYNVFKMIEGYDNDFECLIEFFNLDLPKLIMYYILTDSEYKNEVFNEENQDKVIENVLTNLNIIKEGVLLYNGIMTQEKKDLKESLWYFSKYIKNLVDDFLYLKNKYKEENIYKLSNQVKEELNKKYIEINNVTPKGKAIMLINNFTQLLQAINEYLKSSAGIERDINLTRAIYNFISMSVNNKYSELLPLTFEGRFSYLFSINMLLFVLGEEFQKLLFAFIPNVVILTPKKAHHAFSYGKIKNLNNTIDKIAKNGYVLIPEERRKGLYLGNRALASVFSRLFHYYITIYRRKGIVKDILPKANRVLINYANNKLITLSTLNKLKEKIKVNTSFIIEEITVSTSPSNILSFNNNLYGNFKYKSPVDPGKYKFFSDLCNELTENDILASIKDSSDLKMLLNLSHSLFALTGWYLSKGKDLEEYKFKDIKTLVNKYLKVLRSLFYYATYKDVSYSLLQFNIPYLKKINSMTDLYNLFITLKRFIDIINNVNIDEIDILEEIKNYANIDEVNDTETRMAYICMLGITEKYNSYLVNNISKLNEYSKLIKYLFLLIASTSSVNIHKLILTDIIFRKLKDGKPILLKNNYNDLIAKLAGAYYKMVIRHQNYFRNIVTFKNVKFMFNKEDVNISELKNELFKVFLEVFKNDDLSADFLWDMMFNLAAYDNVFAIDIVPINILKITLSKIFKEDFEVYNLLKIYESYFNTETYSIAQSNSLIDYTTNEESYFYKDIVDKIKDIINENLIRKTGIKVNNILFLEVDDYLDIIRQIGSVLEGKKEEEATRIREIIASDPYLRLTFAAFEDMLFNRENFERLLEFKQEFGLIIVPRITNKDELLTTFISVSNLYNLNYDYSEKYMAYYPLELLDENNLKNEDELLNIIIYEDKLVEELENRFLIWSDELLKC